MENVENGLSTLQEILKRIESRGYTIIRVESSTRDGINIVTFQSGDQATVDDEAVPYLIEHKELWKGGANG